MIFPPAFLDSSSWNDNQHQHQHHQQAQHQQAAVAGNNGEGNTNHEQLLQASSIMGGGGGGLGSEQQGGGGQQVVGPAKPMSMSERARLARIPLPEPGLKCPRCDSTNTKFCYFNNYSLSQPRHFCRACRRYWTRGGALRNVPVGGGYRRHAKRAKPKQQQPSSAASSAAAGTTTAALLAPPSAAACGGGGNNSTTSSTTCTTANVSSLSGPAGMLGGGNHHLSMLPPLLRLADFDAMSLGSSFTTGIGGGKPTIDGNYSAGIGGGPGGLEQWRMHHHQQMQGFPFLHAMDHHQQGSLPPSLAMVMPGAFQLGLDTDGRGAGEDGSAAAGDQLNGMAAAKREGYPMRGGMYADHHHHHLTAAGYTTSYSNATGNHLL